MRRQYGVPTCAILAGSHRAGRVAQRVAAGGRVEGEARGVATEGKVEAEGQVGWMDRRLLCSRAGPPQAHVWHLWECRATPGCKLGKCADSNSGCKLCGAHRSEGFSGFSHEVLRVGVGQNVLRDVLLYAKC